MRRAGGTRRRTRRTAAQWRKLIERFDRSGQTRGTFCAAHGLALSTFDLWRRKLGETQAAADEAPPESLFVELTNAPEAAQSRIPTGASAWEVELELGAGVVLRLRRVVPCQADSRRVESGCAPSPLTCGVRSTDYRPECGGIWVKIRRAVNGSC